MAKIIIKRGPASNIKTLNLEQGEPAYTTDTNKLYIGDGGTAKTLINPDITKTTFGLSDVDNTADSAKPISIATQTALDGKANTSHSHAIANITNLQTTLDGKAGTSHSHASGNITGLGTAATKNTGKESDNIPILNTKGKLDSSVLPAIAITDTFVVGSEDEMLLLSDADVGDIAIRTDLRKCYILKSTGFSKLTNWEELLTPADTVSSVNGNTGDVKITTASIGAEPMISSKNTAFNQSFEASTLNIKMNGTASVGISNNVARADHIHASDTTKANLLSPTFTGEPSLPTGTTAVTQISSDNSKKIATTEFVKAQGYFNASSVIDGGIF